MKTLGLFGKHPDPGRVKTRLAGDIGAAVAARLYAAFMDDLAFRFRGTGDQRILGYCPADTAGFFDRYTKLGYELWPQPEGDLGQKIISFFNHTLKQEGSRAVLIGTDSPTLPIEFVEQALEMLDRVDCVLGPRLTSSPAHSRWAAVKSPLATFNAAHRGCLSRRPVPGILSPSATAGWVWLRWGLGDPVAFGDVGFAE